MSCPVPRRQPLLREFLKSEAYDPYLVLFSSAGSPDLQRELETVSADEREQRGAATVTKFGACGTIDFERATSEATGGMTVMYNCLRYVI